MGLISNSSLEVEADFGSTAKIFEKKVDINLSIYLVDPASSHMLVSKIKPCMSKYKQIYTVKLRTAH